MANLFNFILLLVVMVGILFLGSIVYFKNRKNKVNQLFGLMILFVIFWMISNYLADVVKDHGNALFWTYITFITPSLFVWSLLVFSIYFPVPGKGLSLFKFILLLIPNILTVIFILGGFVVQNVELTPAGVNVIFGTFGGIYVMYFFGYLLASLLILILRRRKLVGLRKIQATYFTIGLSSFVILASATNLIIPFIWEIFWPSKYGPHFSVLFIFFTAYAIVKYRLMDIRFVISRSLLYLILVSFVTTFFLVLNILIANVFTEATSGNAILATFVVSLFIVLTIDPLKKYIAKNTDNIFYKARIDYQEVLRELSEIISLEIDLNNLVYSVNKALAKELKLKQALLFLPNKAGGGFSAFQDHGTKGLMRLKGDHPLIAYLKKNRDLIVLEELEREIIDLPEGAEKKKNEVIRNELAEFKTALCMPVFVEGEMRSILMLGEKLSGDIFNKDDLGLMEVFAPQLGTALEKAKLYQAVQDFNIKLKDEVKRATDDLYTTNQELQERNRYLQTLHNVTSLITRTLDLKKVTQGIVDGISKELGYPGGILLLIDEEKDWIHTEAFSQTPLTQKAIKLLPKPFKEYGESFSKGTTLTIKAAKTGEIQISKSFADFISPLVPKTAANLIQKLLGVKTTVAAPIFSENKVIGVIIFGLSDEQEKISETDFNAMRSLANQTGIVFKNIALYEEIRKTNDKLKSANDQLKQLDQAKSEFMSIASHQLRTPLAGIMGYLSMLEDGDFGKMTPEQARIIDELLQAALRLIRMVNLFLNVTRIEAGRFKLNIEKVDIVKVIQSEIKELQPTANKKKLKLEFNKPAQAIPLLNLDQDKIKDVVLNLVDNAIKYTEKGGITVSVEKLPSTVRVSVKDTGVGIKKEEAEKLFAKFVRGSGVSRLSPDGSGLGLFIARKIIDAHQGKIWAESEGEGKGTTMRFELPIK